MRGAGSSWDATCTMQRGIYNFSSSKKPDELTPCRSQGINQRSRCVSHFAAFRSTLAVHCRRTATPTSRYHRGMSKSHFAGQRKLFYETWTESRRTFGITSPGQMVASREIRSMKHKIQMFVHVIRCLSAEDKEEVSGDEEHLKCNPFLGEFKLA